MGDNRGKGLGGSKGGEEFRGDCENRGKGIGGIFREDEAGTRGKGMGV